MPEKYSQYKNMHLRADSNIKQEGMSMTEGKNLVIVESPGKIKKLQEALGNDFVVKASNGHIRDLDENGLSIDIKNNFAPQYVILFNSANISRPSVQGTV